MRLDESDQRLYALPMQPIARLVVALAIGALILSCGGSEEPKPVATATAAELQAVAERMFPESRGQFGVEFNPCDSGFGGPGGLQSCPITERLRQRLESLKGRNANMICRCQNFSDTRTITVEATTTGGLAHVVLFRESLKLDLIIVRFGDKLLVDDTACTGKPGTSIYESTGPC
ncbi:MAG TPA: hypothetical protein VJB57_11600 [Dehalococcoidia bacterium]|nr:hypothetical protein [Dehalococcoidia bacterium]